MHALRRRLSWASLRRESDNHDSSPPALLGSTSSTQRNSHEREREHRYREKHKHREHRHRRKHSRSRKNYDALPLGGHRPINGSSINIHAAEVTSAQPSAADPARKTEDEGVLAAPLMEPSDSTSSISSGHSYRSSRSSRSTNSVLSSRTAKTSPPSSPPTHHSSSMAIVIEQAHKTKGSEPSTPFITATPPSPAGSPLTRARRRNTQPLETPVSSPPYPTTPPISDMNSENRRRSDYIAYHGPISPIDRTVSPLGRPLSPSEIHPALRAGSPRPRSQTIPSPRPQTTPVEIGSSGSIPQKPIRNSSRREDPYLLLRRFDTVIVVDDSASMIEHWSATRKALESVATVALQHDDDGIDIHFMNHPQNSAVGVRSATHIRRLFSQVQPEGITPTGECLDEILRDYLDRYERSKAPMSPTSSPTPQMQQRVKPLNILVLTDGEPTDDPESVIVSAARKLEKLNAPLHQVGIQFLQIGDEEGAREALEELDDALEGVYGIRDMVDTTRYVTEGEEISGDVLLKTLLGGINRRLDRKQV